MTKKLTNFWCGEKKRLDAVGIEVEKIAGCGGDGQSVSGRGPAVFFHVFICNVGG